MTPLDTIKGCELHVHTGGCIYAEDLLELGREVYHEIDWDLFIGCRSPRTGESGSTR